MTRSNVVLTRQPTQMKLPDHQTLFQHSLPSPSYHSSPPQHASSASLSHSTASDLNSIPDNFAQHSYLPSPFNYDNHHPHFVKDEHVAVQKLIPSSVKGAPAHLRPAIRKRQNSESAKRSRQRRKEAAKIFYRKFDEQCQRLSALETKVAKLIELVKEADDDTTTPRAKQEEEIIPDSFTSSTPATPATPPPPPPPPSQHPSQHHPDPQLERHESIVQSMTVITQDDDRVHVPFEDDLEALLETCIHSQPMFGAC